jgi:hypothetical protein
MLSGAGYRMPAKTRLVAALLGFLSVSPAVAGDINHQDYLNFKDANGVPMGVKRQGTGFLIAYAGLFYTVTESSSLAFIGEDQSYWLADWSHGRLELSTNASAVEPRPADSFRFVDWDGRVWQAAGENGEFIIRPLPALTPANHVQCIKLLCWWGRLPYLSCWAPNGKIRSVSPDDEIVSFVQDFSYLGWDNKPRTAAWMGNRFMIRLDGGPPTLEDALHFLDWDGKKRIATWDVTTSEFAISAP